MVLWFQGAKFKLWVEDDDHGTDDDIDWFYIPLDASAEKWDRTTPIWHHTTYHGTTRARSKYVNIIQRLIID